MYPLPRARQLREDALAPKPSEAAPSRASKEPTDADVSAIPILNAGMAPGHRHVQATTALAIVLLAGFLLTLPWGNAEWPVVPEFVPIVDTALFLSHLVAATLLYAYFAATRSRAILALATGFCFTSFIVVPHALTSPGAFDPNVFLGAGENTSIWLYVFRLAGLLLSMIAYAVLRTRSPAPVPPEKKARAIWVSVLLAVALAVSLTWLTTAGHTHLPALMSETAGAYGKRVIDVGIVLSGLALVAIALLWFGRQSVLDLWLMVMLGAWMFEILMVMMTSSRFSVPWYLGRTYGLLSGVIVLLVLLAETTKLYARLAISVEARRHERDNRLATMDAVAGSIAHEVNQPLAAIVSNANAGLRWLARTPPDTDRIESILKAIASDGHRAADVVAGIRSMFGKAETRREILNINEVLRDAVLLASNEIERNRVIVRLRLSKGLPLVACDRVQMRQVFLNLINNAIEALDGIPSRRRLLVVQSVETGEGEIVIRVRDVGIGIAPDALDRIFDPFFTTKLHGTGLGLPICRSIVEAHGGRLWATQGASKGSVFHISLFAQT